MNSTRNIPELKQNKNLKNKKKGNITIGDQNQNWHMVQNFEWQITMKIIHKFDSVILDGEFFTFKENVTT